MPQLRLSTRWHFFLYPGSLFLLILLLASCGGSSGSMSTASPASIYNHSVAQGGPLQSASGGSSNNQGASAPTKLRMPPSIAQQRLIKTLNVTISVKDTRQAADDLQAWIGSTDPLASSIGTQYNQVSDGVYNITLNFSVEYTLYPKIYSYLSNYAPKNGGYLTSLNEAVQDVTNNYVDTQARIKNDQNELQRLRGLMQTTGSLNDVLALEQRISDVEGDIENTQAHLNQLDNQTTMYTVNITIQPINSAPPIQPNSGWSAVQTVRDAFSASLTFAQALFNFVIWLLAFSVYIIPVLLLLVLYRRYQTRKKSAQPLYYSPANPLAQQTKPVSPRSVTTPQPVAAGIRDEKIEEPDLEEMPVNTPSTEQ